MWVARTKKPRQNYDDAAYDSSVLSDISLLSMHSMHNSSDGKQPGVGEALSVFGASVRRRRKRLGLNQADAAELVGTDQTRWSRIESGRYPSLTLGQALRIQRALRIRSLEEMFGRSPTAALLDIDDESAPEESD